MEARIGFGLIEIILFFVFRKLILKTRKRSHPMGLDVWFLVGPFVNFHTSCVRTAMALTGLRECAGSPEPSLVAYVISTKISWAGSFMEARISFGLNVFHNGVTVFQGDLYILQLQRISRISPCMCNQSGWFIVLIVFNVTHLSRNTTKPTKWRVRPAKTQISLGIRPVWSVSSLSAWRKLGSLATHWAHSEDPDQTRRMHRLIWVFAGCICHFCWFCHVAAHLSKNALERYQQYCSQWWQMIEFVKFWDSYMRPK